MFKFKQYKNANFVYYRKLQYLKRLDPDSWWDQSSWVAVLTEKRSVGQ